MTETMTVAPVVKSVHVECGVASAFEVFTRGIGSWWPLDQLALSPGEVTGGRLGGAPGRGGLRDLDER